MFSGGGGPLIQWVFFMVEQTDPSSGDADRQLDARGLRCPLPLLRAKQVLRDMAVGERLRVLATDSGSLRDFRAFAQISGHTLETCDERDGVYHYLLIKRDKNLC